MTERPTRWRAPIAVLAASFLFNLGQGVLRPAMPLYLQRVFAAKYQMVTFIPVVFGAGKWVASLPTGYSMDRVGRRMLMVGGLLLIALCDVGSVTTSVYGVFLGLRGVAGIGWAMFGTVATTAMVDTRASERRGRAVSLLFISETLGLLLGSTAGGWLYQATGVTIPFVFEAGCMVAGSLAVACWTLPIVAPSMPHAGPATPSVTKSDDDRRALGTVLRIPGVLVMSVTNATLIAIQTGVLVFLFPLYLVNRGNASPGIAGMVVSLGVLGRLVTLWLGGSVSDPRERVGVLVPGLLAYGILLGTLTLLTNPIALGFWSFAIGAAAGFVSSLPTALVGDQVPPSLHAVAIGWLRMMTDTGQIVGPLVMGALADAVDLSTSFVGGAALLLTMAWLCRVRARWSPV